MRSEAQYRAVKHSGAKHNTVGVCQERGLHTKQRTKFFLKKTRKLKDVGFDLFIRSLRPGLCWLTRLHHFAKGALHA